MRESSVKNCAIRVYMQKRFIQEGTDYWYSKSSELTDETAASLAGAIRIALRDCPSAGYIINSSLI
jgi:hypothetical protein